jgi:predicted metal-binding protein
MLELKSKKYLVIIQCHIVKQRCPGYLCEKAFHERAGGFADYPKDKAYRVINLTCGGCPGRELHRKLTLLKRTIKKKEGLDKDKIIVQLSSCITKDNYHAPPCPHLDYLKALLDKIGIDYLEDTVINEKSEQKRKGGIYKK